MDVACSTNGNEEKCVCGLVGEKMKENRPLRNLRLRWECNIADPKKIGLEDVKLIHLTQDRHNVCSVLNTVMSLRLL